MSTKTPPATELAKLILTNLAKVQERLRKVTTERDDLAGRLAKVTTEYTALLQKAAPPRGVAKAVPITR